MITAPDRIEKLKNQAVVTGIDFVYVHQDQVTIDIHFLRSPATLNIPLHTVLLPQEIIIYRPTGIEPIAGDIPVVSIAWINSNEVLQIKVAQPGDFTLYNFKIDNPSVDIYYNDIPFSFKANCPSDLDCAPPGHECPPEDWVDFPVDYLARDFWSYRQALFEFASLRYPDWKDRLEADAGVMLVELMSALGDEMAYYQDRIGRESYLESATQRRSLRRHARLVDYHVNDSLGSHVWLDVMVKSSATGNIQAGKPVWALGDNGIRTDFEIGNGLEEFIQQKPYFVNAAINSLQAYRWDEDQVCLPVNSTELFIDGHHHNDLTQNQPPEKWILLKTTPVNPAQPARNIMVQLTSATDMTDPVLNIPVTLLKWKEPTPFELDMTQLFIHGNIVPATAGITQSYILLAGASLSDLPVQQQTALQSMSSFFDRMIFQCIEREGANDSISFLFTLPGTEAVNLVWLSTANAVALPEVHLTQMEFNAGSWSPAAMPWNWKRSFIGVNSSQPYDEDYTLDDGNWRKVVTYQRSGHEINHYDYASSRGATIRFGDGDFGKMPAEKSVFLGHYRIGGGKSSNLAPDTIRFFNHGDPALAFVDTITNPVNAVGGQDAEIGDEIRQSAPYAFKEITYRAVTPPDYAEAVERLKEVQKAGATQRWTGSWNTVFVTPDPLHAVTMEENLRTSIYNQLNRFRQAGRDTNVLNPLYADLDLEINICVSRDCFPGEVEERVLLALFGKESVITTKGFFSSDRFTFGTPLDRSQLEAAIQNVPGVQAVEAIIFRRRGMFDWKLFEDFAYAPGMNTIIRVENDRLHPERGTLKIHTHGGL